MNKINIISENKTKMSLLNQVYKYGSGNSKVTSLPVSFRYTDAKVSTCNKKNYVFQKNINFYKIHKLSINLVLDTKCHVNRIKINKMLIDIFTIH